MGAIMISVSGSIAEDFLAKLRAGTDVRPDQIDKLAALLKQEKAVKVDELVSMFNSEPPAHAEIGEGK